MTEPNAEVLSDESIPRITLAGKSWPIPMLAPKQNQIIVPAVLRSTPKILAAGDGKGQFDLIKFAQAVDETTYKDLILIVYTALTRAHPQMTRNEFEELPIGTMELVLAVLVVSQQTGVIRPKTREELNPMGEAPAGNSQTGKP